MATTTPVERWIEVGELLPGEGSLKIAADVFLPERPRAPAVALFCLPGGALTRAYYHLEVDDPGYDAAGFSFAAWMATNGFIVITLDHLGTGGSSRPRDGFALTPDVLVTAQALAVDSICNDLLAGRVPGQTQPLAELHTIGVGHSMGAMLTALQQSRDRQHAALILLGFSTHGLAPALTAEEATFAADPQGARRNVVRLARLRSNGNPYPEIASSPQSRDLFAGKNADRRGVEALQKARTTLLVTAGLFSMIPGSCAPECAQIDTPVFLALGDRDIVGPPHQIPASFPASPEVSLLVLCATGHCHFLFPSRRQLFSRMQAWIEAVLRSI
jgi:alpha-beta hydrolase superfamily lysophospholipase